MGKVESEANSEENQPKSINSEEDIVESKEENKTENNTTTESLEKTAQEKKDDVEKIRTIIKVNEKDETTEENKDKSKPITEEKKDQSPIQSEEKKEEPQKPIIPKVPKSPQPTTTPSSGSREELEQRRNILQSIKDFDFQIKKNQEDINKISEKIDGVTKDLDDLVSLYEIVSEQMNPFVGLSKVTKKRIDALENFTQEIEDIKNRMEDVESVVEKSVGGIKILTKRLKEDGENLNPKDTNKTSELDENEKEDLTENNINEASNEIVNEQELQIADSEEKSKTTDTIQFSSQILSDSDLDMILAKSLESFFVEQNIDNMINEFLLNLK